MTSTVNLQDLPQGLGNALAGHQPAMAYFSGLNKDKQQQIIQQAKSIRSKKDMQSFIASLISGN